MKNIFMLITAVLLLAACKDKLSTSYLLEHPRELQREVERCQMLAEKSNAEQAECQSVMSAAVAFTAVLEEAQQDPEKFGQHIMEVETACVQVKNERRNAQQALDALKAKQASAAELQTAQDQLKKIDQSYQAKHEQVKVMLAVLGLSSPE